MDNIHSNWGDEEAVAMALELSDPNQPYSCATWGGQFDDSEPLIVNGGSPYYHWWGMFEDTYVPANAFIDHKMRLHYKTNSLSYATANSKIKEMLEDCGECRVGDEVIEDFSETNQSYQEFCCETFGGLYYDTGTLEWDEYYCVGSESNWVSFCGACSGTVDSDGDGTFDECDDCYNSAGDINEDMTVDILDVVNAVNIILNGGINSSDYTECELLNANYNGDSLINVLDIIQIINLILGQGLNSNHIEINNPSLVSLDVNNSNLNINISSIHDFTGVEISFNSDRLLPVYIESNRTDIQIYTDIYAGEQKVLIFSIDNIPFSLNELDITIEDASMLDSNDLDIIVASKEGFDIPVVFTTVESKSFTMNDSYPNPFNPTTKLTYQVDLAGDLKVTVHNILGQEVAELYNGYQSYGSHSLIWNASNMASGVYYITMQLNGQIENNKVMLIK